MQARSTRTLSPHPGELFLVTAQTPGVVPRGAALRFISFAQLGLHQLKENFFLSLYLDTPTAFHTKSDRER